MSQGVITPVALAPVTKNVVTSFAMKEDAASSGYSGSSPASFGRGASATSVTPGGPPGGLGGGTGSCGPGDPTGAGEVLTPKKHEDLMALLVSQPYTSIKYSAYRIAAKLDLMRSAMCLDEVKLGAVANVFHQHGYSQATQHTGVGGLGSSFACLDVLVDKAKASDITTDLFFSANKARTYYMTCLDVPACADTALQMVMSVYGAGRTRAAGAISAKALKVFFVVLSEGKLMEKLSYLFNDFANSRTRLLSRRSLSAMLRLLARFPEFLQESTNFGSFLVEAAVAQCFAMYSGDSIGVTEEQFKAWMFREPQVAAWLATFYRLVSSKSVRHGVSCAVCRTTNISGLRYQCLRCIGYDLCQGCFFYGRVSRSHKVTHPIQEYCTRSTKRDATKALLKTIQNNLKRRRRSGPVRYLPHQPSHAAVQRTSDKENYPRQDAATARLQHRQSPAATSASSAESEMESYQLQSQPQMAPSTSTIAPPAPTITLQPPEEECTTSALTPALIRSVKGRGDQARLFNSILVHLEEQNHQMMSKLQGTNEETNCAVMQQHLDKLKTLVDRVFVAGACQGTGAGPSVGDDVIVVDDQASAITLNGPSLVESTPLHAAGNQITRPELPVLKQQKLLSRIQLNKNFSPVVLKPQQQQQQQQEHISASGSFRHPPRRGDEGQLDDLFRSDSIIVDTLLNDNNEESFSATEALDGGDPASSLSLQDLTSLLVKTGFNFQFEDTNQVSQMLEPSEGENQGFETGENREDIAEEIETLMLRLETVFKSYHDKTIVNNHQKQTMREFDGGSWELQQIVAEIADQIQAFSQVLPPRLPSVRSEGDGLSNPSPDPIIHTTPGNNSMAITVNP